MNGRPTRRAAGFRRRRRWNWLLLGLVLLVGNGAAVAAARAQTLAPVPDALKGVRRIVCLGDSITQQGEAPGGYVGSCAGPWPPCIRRKTSRWSMPASRATSPMTCSRGSGATCWTGSRTW
jgi:hypothetical protein